MIPYKYIYSLIIPHYNIPYLLERLLNTIPQRDDFQVIVVDDCSPEECQNQISRIQEKFPDVEFYSTGTNGGGGKARNIGLSHAKGKYVIFADADDYFNLCFDEMLDKYQNSDFDIIYFCGNSVDTETYINSDRDAAITLLVGNYLITKNEVDIKYKFTAPWCKFISNGLIRENNIRFYESPVYNDMHFSLISDFYAKKIIADKHAIYCVTQRSGSVSSVTSIEKEEKKIEVVASYYKKAKQLKVPISPLWVLLGPMLENIRKSGGRNLSPSTLALWKEIGISKPKLNFLYWRYNITFKFLYPVKSILRNILNAFKI